jgi:hypothetical protein
MFVCHLFWAFFVKGWGGNRFLCSRWCNPDSPNLISTHPPTTLYYTVPTTPPFSPLLFCFFKRMTGLNRVGIGSWGIFLKMQLMYLEKGETRLNYRCNSLRSWPRPLHPPSPCPSSPWDCQLFDNKRPVVSILFVPSNSFPRLSHGTKPPTVRSTNPNCLDRNV